MSITPTFSRSHGEGERTPLRKASDGHPSPRQDLPREKKVPGGRSGNGSDSLWDHLQEDHGRKPAPQSPIPQRQGQE